VSRSETIKTYETTTGIDADIFRKLLLLKSGELKPPESELRTLFEGYYNALDATGKIIDELRV
jgi:hypothetical protein